MIIAKTKKVEISYETLGNRKQVLEMGICEGYVSEYSELVIEAVKAESGEAETKCPVRGLVTAKLIEYYEYF